MKIGKIGEILSCSFEWKIHDFLDNLNDVDAIYESPDFEFDSATWYFQLYPNGKNKGDLSGWISLFLVRRSSKYAEHILKFEFNILDENGIEYTCRKNPVKKELVANDAEWGWLKYLEISNLLEDKNKIVPKGVLRCRITINGSVKAGKDKTASKDCVTSSLWESVICNMKDLFLKQKNCDVTIRVKEQEFKAHRTILEARCPVLAAMFEHDVKENGIGAVEITDAEPKDFREFLLYLYCGEIEKLSSENVTELYALADTYELGDLKGECVRFLESFLSVETVCEALYIGEIYSEMRLKKLAKNFLNVNRSEILATDKWKEFEAENRLVAYQTIKSILLEKGNESQGRLIPLVYIRTERL